MLERDLRTILAVQALRAFAYGFGSVLLGTVLARRGLSDAEVGAVFAAMLAGLALSSLAVATRGHRTARRRLYVLLLCAMGASGAVFAITGRLPLLVLASLTGTLSTDPNESGPITSLEQAMMGGAPTDMRARVFGRYNAVAYLAGSVGALSAGGPAAFRRVLPSLPGDQRWLLAFPVVAVGCVAFARRLSGAVEVERRTGGRALERSRGTVLRLSLLFGLDAGAGGFIVQSFMVFWFHRRFHASTELMGAVFFGVGLLQAGSSVAAGRLAGRIGLLNVMVFTHLPSNVFLLLIPFAPSLPLAIAFLLCRSALSQMDVPARQAYVVAMVDPHERTAAASFTNTARYVARPAGAGAAGAAMERIAVGAPFVFAGGLKIVYDLILYATFRRVPLPR
jgi:predicted MFS family arabinose efflux permease